MKKYYSQHGEDALLDLIFGDQAKGTFVEVGCIDGRCFSNTLVFEERGWSGLCVEAHGGYIDKLIENRPNSIVCHCAAAEENEDSVFYANARGSLSTLDRSKEDEFRRDYGSYFSGFEVQEVKKVKLSTLLDKYKFGDIDILSLDIEGYEIEALQGLDLARHRPKVLVVECDSKKHEEKVDKILLPFGYVKSVCLSVNRFYVLNKELDGKLRGKRFECRLVHTQHPLDRGGDRVVKVLIDTTVFGVARNLLARSRSEITRGLKKFVRGLAFGGK